MAEPDLYAILGVPRTANADDIRRRYRQLAKELHPDLNPDKPDVADRFKDVSAAYEILSDPEKRGRYDRGEIDASGQERQRTFYRDFAEDPGRTRFYRREGFADDDELQAFFSDLFGQTAGGREGTTFRPRARGADVSYTLPVSFLEAARGGQKRVTVDGRTLDINIPPGVRHGQMLRLKGRGLPGFEGGPTGDAYVEIRVEPHPLFVRKDQDIHVELAVSLGEAALGARVEVPTIDGPVQMTVPKGSNTGSTLRLRGRGLVDPATGARGDQYVRLKVVLPKTIDPDLETFLERWSKAHPYDPRAGLGGGG